MNPAEKKKQVAISKLPSKGTKSEGGSRMKQSCKREKIKCRGVPLQHRVICPHCYTALRMDLDIAIVSLPFRAMLVA